MVVLLSLSIYVHTIIRIKLTRTTYEIKEFSTYKNSTHTRPRVTIVKKKGCKRSGNSLTDGKQINCFSGHNSGYKCGEGNKQSEFAVRKYCSCVLTYSSKFPCVCRQSATTRPMHQHRTMASSSFLLARRTIPLFIGICILRSEICTCIHTYVI
jgi:hypothetical protein